MAASELLRMLITADTGQAVTSIRAVGQTTQKELGGSSKTIDKWSRGLTTAGAGMVAFGGAALVGLGMAAKSAVDLGEAVNASNVVFGEASGVIDKYAEDSATSMGLSERAFRQALTPIGAMLQNYGFSADEAAEKSVELGQRAADMASVFNTDVTTALEAIQAGLRGESDPLEKFGVGLNEAAVNAKAMELGLAGSTGEVDAAAKTQARLALIMEQTSKFQGDFANTSDSLANRQRVLAAQFENLKAAIGEGALPVFETFLDVASKGIGVFEGLDDSTQGAIGKFTAFGAVGLIVAGGVSIVIGQLLKMRQNFKDAALAVSGFRNSLAGLSGVLGPVGVAGALIAAGAGFATYLKSQNEAKIAAAAEAFAKLRDVTKETVSATELLNDAVRVSTIDFTAGESVQKEFARTGELTNEVMRDLNKGWDEIIEKSPQFAQGFIDSAEAAGVGREQLAQWRGELQGKISDDQKAIAATDEYNAAVQGTGEATGEATSGVDDLGGAMGDQAEETEDATSALQDYSDRLTAMTDPIFGAMDAIDGVRDAQLAEADAAAASAEARVALNEALAGGNEEEIAEATRNLEDAERDHDDALQGTVEAAFNADAALAKLQDSVESGETSVGKFKDTLAVWVAQGILTQDQANRAAAEVANLGDAAFAADRERVDIPVTTPGSDKARTELRGTRDDALSVPTERKVGIATSGARAARVELQGVRDAVHDIPSSKTVTVNVAAHGVAAVNILIAKLGERQHGGPVRAGAAYLVGENQPEVFVPDRNGMILPSVESLDHWAGSVNGAGLASVISSSTGRIVARLNALLGETARHADISFAGHAGTHAGLRSIRLIMRPVSQQVLDRMISPSELLARTVRLGGRSVGRFHDGGMVPGPPGSEMLAYVQAGEYVSPARSGGSGGTVVVNMDLRGAVISNRHEFDAMVKQSFQRLGDNGNLPTIRGRSL